MFLLARSSISRRCFGVTFSFTLRVALATMHHTLQAISQEIQPQYERGERQTRKQRHPRKYLCHSPGFADHAAPIGRGRRQAKAEEAEHPDCDCHVAKAQTRIDDQWTQGIR